MPEPVAVLSSEEIPKESVFAAIREVGGHVVDPSRGHGQLSEGDSNVWVYFEGSDFGDLTREDLAAAAQRLGANPRTHIVLDVGRGAQSKDLLVNFVRVLASRWPVVIYDLEDSFFSVNELTSQRQDTSASPAAAGVQPTGQIGTA